MKLKWFGMVALSTLLMVGCSEDETTNGEVKEVSSEVQKQDIAIDDSIPEGVKDGRVSKTTYSESARIIDGLTLYATRNKSYINEMEFDINVIKKDDFQRNYNDFLNEYDVFIKGFNASPSTSADFELNDHLISIIYNTEAYIEEMRMFIKDGDSYYNENAISYSNKRQVSLEALVNAMDKYDLFIEK